MERKGTDLKPLSLAKSKFWPMRSFHQINPSNLFSQSLFLGSMNPLANSPCTQRGDPLETFGEGPPFGIAFWMDLIRVIPTLNSRVS